jgi:hypothetical protein
VVLAGEPAWGIDLKIPHEVGAWHAMPLLDCRPSASLKTGVGQNAFFAIRKDTGRMIASAVLKRISLAVSLPG